VRAACIDLGHHVPVLKLPNRSLHRPHLQNVALVCRMWLRHRVIKIPYLDDIGEQHVGERCSASQKTLGQLQPRRRTCLIGAKRELGLAERIVGGAGGHALVRDEDLRGASEVACVGRWRRAGSNNLLRAHSEREREDAEQRKSTWFEHGAAVCRGCNVDIFSALGIIAEAAAAAAAAARSNMHG